MAAHSSCATASYQQLITATLNRFRFPVTYKSNHSLYSVLSLLPHNGIGALVRPIKYHRRKQPDKSFYQIVDSNLDHKSKVCRHVYGYRWYNGKLATKTVEPQPLDSCNDRIRWELFKRSHAPPHRQIVEFRDHAKAVNLARLKTK